MRGCHGLIEGQIVDDDCRPTALLHIAVFLDRIAT
jgi:hypothetical protein